MALDSELLVKEQFVENLGILETWLFEKGKQIVTKVEKISAGTEVIPTSYNQHITHRYTIMGQVYKGTLIDQLNRETSLSSPDEGVLHAYRKITLMNIGERIFSGERTLGGYQRTSESILPIELDLDWKIAYDVAEPDALMHLERALNEFQYRK